MNNVNKFPTLVGVCAIGQYLSDEEPVDVHDGIVIVTLSQSLPDLSTQRLGHATTHQNVELAWSLCCVCPSRQHLCPWLQLSHAAVLAYLSCPTQYWLITICTNHAPKLQAGVQLDACNTPPYACIGEANADWFFTIDPRRHWRQAKRQNLRTIN